MKYTCRKKLMSLLKAVLPVFFLAIVATSATAQSSAPVWTETGNHPRFPHEAYLSGMGVASSLEAADMGAFANLASFFGQQIESVTRIFEAYRSVIVNGVEAWGETTDIQSVINGAVRMDNLMAAQIAERWHDGRGNFFSLAVLNKATAQLLYDQRIRANQSVINSLTSMTTLAERNSFGGVARYRAAAVLADTNIALLEMLTILGVDWIDDPLPPGEEFLRRAQNVIAAIPIGVNIRSGNDPTGSIHGAFARVFTEAGFLVGGASPRYVLNVDFTNVPTQHTAHGAIHKQLELRANLIDTLTGAILLPYNLRSRRLGARTASGAVALTLRDAMNTILSEYPQRLSNHLAQLVPRR